MIIYCDGIFDMLHAGHITTFKYIKNMYDNVYLVVGVISDDDSEGYKRRPVICEQHRILMLESCKYVDKVIPNSPLYLTEDFINEHKIDLIVHGFYDKKDYNKQDVFFKLPKSLNKFKEIPYSYIESTTSIIKRAANYLN